ncbi:hypothetical protein STTU_5950 [Streptomyces sp. Tu6071]|nr:hypothetical protein STTU_5950 [Streptomyces sp. Tu6071]
MLVGRGAAGHGQQGAGVLRHVGRLVVRRVFRQVGGRGPRGGRTGFRGARRGLGGVGRTPE